MADTIMRNILKFKNYNIKDKEINFFLNLLTDYVANFDIKIDKKLFLLLQNKTLNELVSYSYYEGNIDIIENYFNNCGIDYSLYNKYIDKKEINDYIVEKTKILSKK